MQEDITCDSPRVNNGNIKKLLQYNSFAQRDKTSYLSYIKHRSREWETEREQIEVLLQHIQIYPGDVLPNMQDLFMSVSISASHLQTESAASTPQHSQAYVWQCMSHTYGRQPYCLESCSHLLTRIMWLDYTPKQNLHFQGQKTLMRNDQLKWPMTELRGNKPPGQTRIYWIVLIVWGIQLFST